MKNLFFCIRHVHTRLTRYYIRPFQYDSCYDAVTTYFDFALLYQHFNAKSTSMFNNICFGCITIRVKGVNWYLVYRVLDTVRYTIWVLF